MQPLHLTALTVTSAMGRGLAAMLEALRARRSGLRPCDFEDVRLGHIGRVEGLEAHELPPGRARCDSRNNRLADLALDTDGFADAVASARAHYGPDRIAVVLGTSTSGVLSAEAAFRERDRETGALPEWFDYDATHDVFSLGRYVRDRLGLAGPAMVVSAACASSARAFVDAHHLIETGACDAAVVGGVDTLCRMTLRGFAALDLVSPVPCRPCDVARAGISIGEAGGFALLERPGARPLPTDARPVALLGHGASSDGHHMSAPHPEGRGAVAAMREALARAGLAPSDVDYVNLHGTGTRANDAMEDLAVSAVFGQETPCSSTKGWSGHALGAAGILEAAISALCIRHGLMPGCLGVETPDPAFAARVLVENAAAPVRRVMSNSFGFGGINCSLLLGEAA